MAAAQVLQFDDGTHQGIEALLPWFVNGSLAHEERARVEHHLAECLRCQREVEWQRELQSAYRSSEFAPDAMDSFTKLCSALDEPRMGLRSSLGHLERFWLNTERWARWTIALEFVLLLSVGILAVAGTRDKAYQTLGAPEATRPNADLVVVFDPALPEARLRELLRRVDARIVGGPTQNGAYLLQFSAGNEQAALRTLRADRAVTLAEPLGAEQAR